MLSSTTLLLKLLFKYISDSNKTEKQYRGEIEPYIRMRETAVIRKQKAILPTVSSLAFPDGNRFGSTRFTALFEMIRVTFDMGSKIASGQDDKLAQGVLKVSTQSVY